MSAVARAASFFIGGGLTWAAGATGTYLNPYMGFNFLVEIDGLIIGGFNQVQGLSGEIRTETFIEGGMSNSPHPLLGETSWPNIVLQKGMTDLDTLWSWFDATNKGILRPKDGVIMLLDQRRWPAMFWEFTKALPVKWEGPSLDATAGNAAAVERLTLAHSGLRRPEWHRIVGAARLALAASGV